MQLERLKLKPDTWMIKERMFLWRQNHETVFWKNGEVIVRKKNKPNKNSPKTNKPHKITITTTKKYTIDTNAFPLLHATTFMRLHWNYRYGYFSRTIPLKKPASAQGRSISLKKGELARCSATLRKTQLTQTSPKRTANDCFPTQPMNADVTSRTKYASSA